MNTNERMDNQCAGGAGRGKSERTRFGGVAAVAAALVALAIGGQPAQACNVRSGELKVRAPKISSITDVLHLEWTAKCQPPTFGVRGYEIQMSAQTGGWSTLERFLEEPDETPDNQALIDLRNEGFLPVPTDPRESGQQWGHAYTVQGLPPRHPAMVPDQRVVGAEDAPEQE